MIQFVHTVGHWLRVLTTGTDDRSPDVIRIGGILLGTQFLVNSGWSTFVLKAPFDASAYGVGAGALLAAIGAALRWKLPAEGGA